jgi:hypothetical protein
MSAKLMSAFADRGSHVVSVTDPYGRILGFLDWSRDFNFQVASSIVLTRLSVPRYRPTTSQKMWWCLKLIPGFWICNQELWPLDHRGGLGFCWCWNESSGSIEGAETITETGPESETRLIRHISRLERGHAGTREEKTRGRKIVVGDISQLPEDMLCSEPVSRLACFTSLRIILPSGLDAFQTIIMLSLSPCSHLRPLPY